MIQYIHCNIYWYMRMYEGSTLCTHHTTQYIHAGILHQRYICVFKGQYIHIQD